MVANQNSSLSVSGASLQSPILYNLSTPAEHQLKDKLNLLIVAQSFKPMWERGGVARVATELASQFAKKGYNITVNTLNRDSTYNLTEDTPITTDAGIVYYFSMGCRIISSIIAPLPSNHAKHLIKQNIHNYNLLHVHDYRSPFCLYVAMSAHKAGIPYIIQAHGSLPYLGKAFLKKIYDFLFGKRLLNGASAVVALSETEAQYYEKFGVPRSKIHIIPNGIDSEYFPLPEVNSIREKYSIDDSDKLVTFVGRIDATKGIDLLIDAFSHVHSKISDSKLLLVGSVRSEDYWEAVSNKITGYNLSDAVIVTGFVSSDEKKQLLLESDVFVTPSYSGFPLTFLEACACQTPIVTTKNGDTLDWIKQVGVVTEYDAPSLADGIVQILSADAETVSQYKELAAKFVEEKFNWAAISAQYEYVYSTVLQCEKEETENDST